MTQSTNNNHQTPDAAIKADAVYKQYKTKKHHPPYALENFSLTIPRGSLFGLLGPNGAGKSTFINILAGIVRKTSGTITIWNVDIDTNHREAKMYIGVVPQELNLDPFFTPREMLDLHAGLYGIPRAKRQTDALLETVGLSHKSDAYARTLSGGMRRRLMMAKAMVHTPPILVLDEPTAGVDIELRQHLWKQIRTLNARGVTVVLTTHYLNEAEELCKDIAIIDKGKIIANDKTDNLLAHIEKKEVVITIEEPLQNIPASLKHYDLCQNTPHQLRFSYAPRKTALQPLIEALQKEHIRIRDITTRQSDLEDVFIKLTRPSHSTP
ncbi:MAG: ABC transporter ATP-binding protein [Alphaproteobacteria bacterium GM7ARS4]|nr:ABC transporter ATP-binding protein [Alphaproteobacteria bacterium GM7ARS4]